MSKTSQPRSCQRISPRPDKLFQCLIGMNDGEAERIGDVLLRDRDDFAAAEEMQDTGPLMQVGERDMPLFPAQTGDRRSRDVRRECVLRARRSR